MFSTQPGKHQLFAVICVVLTLVTMAVYWPVTHHGFTTFDDTGYITANSHVSAGLTWKGIIWAFQTPVAGNWHPLTMICLMLESRLYGANPAGYHLTSLLFHSANTLLLFLLLNGLTGAAWRSACVAALFAWHPLHVESVAWAAERKDVLCAFFWMLTLLAYTCYARNVDGNWRRASVFYMTALFFFACSLMSKPMAVTLPFVLLLMDHWPLHRLRFARAATESNDKSSPVPANANPRPAAWFLILEKLPFFVLALATSVITYLTQQSKGAIWYPSFYTRIANALTAYMRYISKTFWPVDLTVVYPYSHDWPVWLVIFASLFLAIWSVLLILRARQRPYLIVGWCWFLGVLFPTIGIVQVGVQSMADRYTYVPSIGLFILVVWGVNDFLELRPHKSQIAALAGTLVLGACLVCSNLQLKYWQNSLSLFVRAIQVTSDNYLAYNCLGNALEEVDRKDEALALYTESVRVKPGYAPGQFNLGMLLLERGELAEASNHLALAVQLTPNNGIFQFDLGVFLLRQGNLDEAANHFNAALDEAPDFPLAHNGLAQVLHRQNKSKEAISHYRKALRSWPDCPDALGGLAWILSTTPDPKLRSGRESLQLANRACELAPKQNPDFLTTLSAAYAETGQFSNAIVTVQKARNLAQAAGQLDIVAKGDELLKFYQSNQPFRETLPAPK